MHTSSLAARVMRAAAVIGLIVAAACAPDAPSVVAPPPTDANLIAVGRPDDLGPARAAQARHTGRLLGNRDVLGTGIGRLSDGRPGITVYARNAAAAARLPRELDGIPVVAEVTGDITVLPAVARVKPQPKPDRPPGGGNGGGGGTIKPTDYARPAYIGMSTGNAGECASGTIGAKISKGGTIYALSNNHVFARENDGASGETIYQPGRYDLNCASGAQYEWGTLSAYKDISFGGNNTADAALARVTNAANLVGSTPPGVSYGSPSSTLANASLNLAVQKFGRTTGHTTGVIVGVNVTIRVQYSSGIATFVNQIQIRGDKGAFSRSGDSGSLIVTRTGNHPVGLLFAGGQTSTFANTIQDALQAVGGGSIVP
ncbi:MAG TPA: hypothetical protein VFZ21_03680 [Gemmatimonadaceae bacterium]|nr:hypothetical protein [Gemmatimonadaceae bacterium]